MERLGGVGSHMSPFVQAQDVGGLLSKAGFDMITLDLDEIEVTDNVLFENKPVLGRVSKHVCIAIRFTTHG